MKIFEPLDINGMVIPNRIYVPAMVTRLSGEDGLVNQDIIDRYVRYAEGGAGLIVVEAMAIHDVKSGPLLRIADDRFVPGLADLVKRVHDTSDSKVVPQIIHFLKIARSGWRQTVDMVGPAEIDQIVEQFGDAVARAREAGFDGAELHSAHAYTLASFVSRRNPRDDDYGKTLEGRLRLIGRVMHNVRRKVGADFPVGVRMNAEEFIRGGYTIEEGKLIALRHAQLGCDYVSLSVGGKFEDAEHHPGKVKHAYSGYSGERAMPDAWYPDMPHVGRAAAIKAFVNAKGFATPIVTAGKIWRPEDAEAVLAEGKADIVGIARQLLADPDWPNKVRRGEADRSITCDYCNVCKVKDGEHEQVVCFLWPKGALQAPPDLGPGEAPQWGADGGGLGATWKGGATHLKWSKAEGAAGYDVYRADDDGNMTCIEASKVTRWPDRTVLAGMRYHYYVRAYDASGRAGPPSNSVVVEPPVPDFGGRDAA
jgi:2,4-dienoyl-CoA reductase-like NADH-dependent reductase (Old Yellow Enzyme family)